MTDLLPISELTVDDVEGAVRASLTQQPAPGRDALRDFLASVDWSMRGAADIDVIELLGKLEDATTSVQEDPSSADTFMIRLMAFLPEDRLVSILLDGIVFTLMPGNIKLTEAPSSQLPEGQSAQPLRIALATADLPVPAL
ncbi:MAG: hypothetical protein V3R95_00130 [Dehalococcoidia bacterium]